MTTARRISTPAKPGRPPEALPATLAITGVGKSDWLRPISALEPCGPTLEYDAEYAVLMARLAPQADAQYGTFVDRPDLPEWAEVERDCRRLLLRSKDINLFIWLLRCRVRLGGASGLRDVLSILADVLEHFPDDVHPQLKIEGEADPEVRANALAGLTDPQGLLSDVREIVVSASTAFRLNVKDIERAFAMPRLAEALPADAVRQQLDDLRWHKNPQFDALRDSGVLLQRIERWSLQQLGEDAPTLQPLSKLLVAFTAEDEKAAQAALTVPCEAVASGVDPLPVVSPVMACAETPVRTPDLQSASMALVPVGVIGSQGDIASQRDQVRAYIREAKEWL